MIQWTAEDSDKSESQGWGIFYSPGSENGEWQLQKIDDKDTFEKDTDAWEFVYKQFLVGDNLSANALLFLSQSCLEEFQRIKKHCEETIVKDGLYVPV